MRVCICGDRSWDNDQFIKQVMSMVLSSDDVLIHGAAKGADSIAGKIAKDWGLNIESYPANWSRYGKGAGPKRNLEMIDSGLDLVLAFHNNLESSKGTKHMVASCRKAGIPVGVFSA